MIRHIIFDMGNVLLRFDRELFLDRVGAAGEDRKRLMEEVYLSVEWVMMDRGTLDEPDAEARMCARLPEGLHSAVHQLTSRWDQPILPVEGMEALVREVICGIRACFGRFGEIASLSVDTWGVDYVLLKGDQEVWPCHAYRDSRTDRTIPLVHNIIPFEELYRHTGIQFQTFNTIYQLYADKLNDVGIMAYPLEYMSPKLPGLGDVNWGKYISALTDIGYDSFVCVEVEKGIKNAVH